MVVMAFGLPDSWSWVLPFGLIGIISWTFWLVRKILSASVRPVVNDFRTTCTIVVPSYHEDPQVLVRCIDTWIAEGPQRVIIVLDVADTEAKELIDAMGHPHVEAHLFKHNGKRSALGYGMRLVDTELCIFIDSDTVWMPGMYANIQMPFVDPAVGAVSTRQNVYLPKTSLWRRVADWIIDLRYYDYAPAMGRFGGIICASGRTSAYRFSVIKDRIEDLEHEIFWGRQCIAGDDGRLTWLVLSQGYRVAHQDSARALSMFPDSFKTFTKQRVRWSRNSYRCYITAIRHGWIFKTPLISQITIMQILLTPITALSALYYVGASWRQGGWLALSISIAWLVIGRGIRGISHLWRRPEDIWILPVVAFAVMWIALPVKAYAFFTMNKQGWLTRTADSIGGEGQSEASLTRDPPKAAA